MFFRVDERDIHFVLFEHLKVHELAELPAYSDHSKDMYEQILREASKFAREVMYPANAPADRAGCKFVNGEVEMPPGFKEIYQKYVEGGWLASSISPESGGMGLPLTLDIAATEQFIAACASFVVTPALTRSGAHLIETFGAEELKDLYCAKMYEGEWSGTMCLTEAQAGSAVGDIKTTAKANGDHYLLSGQKVFITSGEHDLTEQIVHLVLAKTENAPPGIKGVSLFLVPKYHVNADGSLGDRNDVACVGIEEKMGIHGSSTCTIAFGEEGKCVGYLIGQENQGIRYMFQMMNEARIGVGLQGLGIAAAAYEAALAYAKDRIQGTDSKVFKDPMAPRIAIIKHPDVRRMLVHMKALIEGMRALLYKTGLYADLASNGPEADRDRYEGIIGLLTPICKAYASDSGFKVCDLAMQVHGGYGYIKEYGVEQHMRDVKIASIYEGTNGIQAIDLIARKVAAKGGLVFMNFIQELNGFVEAHKSHPRLGTLVEHLEKAKDTVARITMRFGEANMSGEVYFPLLHASPYLTSFGDLVLAWLLLEQAVLADEKLQALGGDPTSSADARFYDGKVKTADFFVTNVLPEVEARAAAVDSGSKAALEILFDGEEVAAEEAAA